MNMNINIKSIKITWKIIILTFSYRPLFGHHLCCFCKEKFKQSFFSLKKENPHQIELEFLRNKVFPFFKFKRKKTN